MHGCFAHTYVCALTCVRSAYKGQKTVPDTLGLELQVAVSLNRVLEIETKFSGRAASAVATEPSFQPKVVKEAELEQCGPAMHTWMPPSALRADRDGISLLA